MNTSKTKTLVTIDDPDAARIADLVATIPAVELLRRARHATAAELDCRAVRRAIHTATDNAAHRLHAEPPEWLTTWLGPQPTNPARSAVWDDATTRIAHHRLLHNTPHTEPGIGPRPTDPADEGLWQEVMLRLLEDRIWLADHPTPTPNVLASRTPIELSCRQRELQQMLDTAPVDQRQLIDRIVHSALDPTQMHEYLIAAIVGQDTRRDWIITNWPHIVELEQVTQLITILQTQPHWPSAQPDPVRTMLDQLRDYVPHLDQREERSLAELAQQEIDSDPVRRIEARQHELQQLSRQTMSPAENEALHLELVNVSAERRRARREQAVEQTFNRYLPNPIDDARATHIATLAADTLTNQPAWVIDHVRYLHNNYQLTSTDTRGTRYPNHHSRRP